MKKVILLFVILFALILAVSYTKNLPDLSSIPLFKTQKITIDKTTFKLYVAKTPQEKETGLSKYSKLNQDMGMIFVFDKPDFYSFWMKNMKFPIDIIFINKAKIVTIFQNAQPPKEKNSALPILTPKKPADTVLEINAGLSKKYNFKEGDPVKINL